MASVLCACLKAISLMVIIDPSHIINSSLKFTHFTSHMFLVYVPFSLAPLHCSSLSSYHFYFYVYFDMIS